MHTNIKLKPFLKWAGGKTQLLDDIIQNLPSNIDSLRRYVEPFVGAGAVFIYFLENNYFDEYIINDINSKLINLYRVIRDDVEELILGIENLKNRYLGLEDMGEREALFYEIRNRFNNQENYGNVDMAIYFLFLNKTCFNGLYRENSRGDFNVPFGKYKNPSFYDAGLLIEMSRLLNLRNENGEFKAKILNRAFEDVEEFIDDNTFVYCDPPYRPVTVGGFTSYNKGNFNDDAQISLRDFCKEMDFRGAKIMLSNSDPKNLDVDDTFFDALYKGFNIQRIYAKRAINSIGSGRGKISELLITNYDIMGDDIVSMMEMEEQRLCFDSYFGKSPEELMAIFMSSLLETNRGFNFYVNWERPSKIIKQYELELNALNVLVKKNEDEYDKKFRELLRKLPTVINVFPALFALSKAERKNLSKGKDFIVVNPTKLESDLMYYKFNINADEKLTEKEIENYLGFTEKIGLKKLFTELLEKHLIDYLIGCEVGLDSNARKNRGGEAFELALEPVIRSIVEEKYGIEVLIQTKFEDLRERGFEISEDVATRKADFILIRDNKKAMNIEANFFDGSGSKPQEIISSYITRQKELKELNIDFAFITDGKKCWGKGEQAQLLKGFRELKYVSNYNMSKNGMLEEIVKHSFGL